MTKKTDKPSEANSTPVSPDAAAMEIAAQEGVIIQPTPIIIRGGSLSIESVNVDFRQFTSDGPRRLRHPRESRVISIDIFDGLTATLPPRFTYVPPANGQFVVVINY